MTGVIELRPCAGQPEPSPPRLTRAIAHADADRWRPLSANSASARAGPACAPGQRPRRAGPVESASPSRPAEFHREPTKSWSARRDPPRCSCPRKRRSYRSRSTSATPPGPKARPGPARPGDPVQPAPDHLSLVTHLSPVFRIEIALRRVLPMGEVDGLATAIQDIVEDLVPARRAAPRTHDAAFDGSTLDGSITRITY